MNFDRSISGWQYDNASFAISCNKGNTQEKLANITGIKKYFISMFERGEKYPTVKEWNIICDALNNNELRERGLYLIEKNSSRYKTMLFRSNDMRKMRKESMQCLRYTQWISNMPG